MLVQLKLLQNFHEIHTFLLTTVLTILMVSALKEINNIIEPFRDKSIPFRKNLFYISLLLLPNTLNLMFLLSKAAVCRSDHLTATVSPLAK